MIFQFSLEEKDYLEHQLYIASRSERIRKKRRNSRIGIPVLYGALGLYFLWEGSWILAAGFLAFGVLWFFIYPGWETRKYVKHYRDFIRENHKSRINRPVTLEINDAYILQKDEGSESKIAISEIASFVEIPSTILIRLKTGQSFILPKDKVAHLTELQEYLRQLAQSLQISYIFEGDWKWK